MGNKKEKTFSAHRIVAEIFVPNDDPKLFTQVDHIDGSKENYAGNLHWCTPSQNCINRRKKF